MTPSWWNEKGETRFIRLVKAEIQTFKTAKQPVEQEAVLSCFPLFSPPAATFENIPRYIAYVQNIQEIRKTGEPNVSQSSITIRSTRKN